MLSMEDCIALSALTREEIDAIAEHEHLPPIVAAELGTHLLRSPTGVVEICMMIDDNIRMATARGHVRHAAELKLTLERFLERHSPAEPHYDYATRVEVSRFCA